MGLFGTTSEFHRSQHGFFSMLTDGLVEGVVNYLPNYSNWVDYYLL